MKDREEEQAHRNSGADEGSEPGARADEGAHAEEQRVDESGAGESPVGRAAGEPVMFTYNADEDNLPGDAQEKASPAATVAGWGDSAGSGSSGGSGIGNGGEGGSGNEGSAGSGSGSGNGSGSGSGKGGSGLWMGISFGLFVLLVLAVALGPLLDGGKSPEVVAEVNGSEIDEHMLYEALLEAGGQGTLESLITNELLSQEMQQLGETVSDEEIEAELTRISDSYPSKEEFAAALQQYGMNEDALRKQIRQQQMLRKVFDARIDTSEERLQTYFEEVKSYMSTPEEMRASHILVNTREEAEAIVAELAGGADFAAVAAEKSVDSGSAAQGGDLNFFGRGMMDPAFEAAAFALEVGETSDIVESSFGYHIILKTDYRPAVEPTFEEKREELREQLVNEELYNNSITWMEELKAGAQINNLLYPVVPSTEEGPAMDGEAEEGDSAM